MRTRMGRSFVPWRRWLDWLGVEKSPPTKSESPGEQTLLILNQVAYMKGIRDGIITIAAALRKQYPEDNWDQVEAGALESAEHNHQRIMPEAYALYRAGQQYVENKMKGYRHDA